MKTYKIAGFHINLSLGYNNYFQDISKYLTTDQPDCPNQMTIRTLPSIPPPTTKPTHVFRNREIHLNNGTETIYVYDKFNTPKQRHVLTKQGRHVVLDFTPTQILSLSEMMYAVSGLFFMDIALIEEHLALHASAILHQGQVILLSAPSQGGKSTHTKHWMKQYPDSTIINEDKPLIYEQDGSLLVAGSPWSGKHTIHQNKQAPIKAIVFLTKASKVAINIATPSTALRHMMRNTHRPRAEHLVDAWTNRLNQVIASVPIYELNTTITSEAVSLLHQTLYSEESV